MSDVAHSDVVLPFEPHDGLVIEYWSPNSGSDRVDHYKYVYHVNSKFREVLPRHYQVGPDFKNCFAGYLNGVINSRWPNWSDFRSLFTSNKYGPASERYANECDAHVRLIDLLENKIEYQRTEMNRMEMARRNSHRRLTRIVNGEATDRQPMSRAMALDLLNQYCMVAAEAKISDVIQDAAGMFERLPPGADDGKVMRWLGYIQGALVEGGVYTLEQVKRHAATGEVDEP